MSAPQTKWRPEARALLCLAVLMTVVFAVTPLDLVAARIFYRPLGADREWSILGATQLLLRRPH